MSRRGLEARLGRVVQRLADTGGFGFPAGPVEGWPGAEQCRLERMVEAGGAVRRGAWTRLTDVDLKWAIAFWLGEADADEWPVGRGTASGDGQ